MGVEIDSSYLRFDVDALGLGLRDYSSLVEEGRILSAWMLSKLILPAAFEYLISEPGPNQIIRAALADEWIGNLIRLLSAQSEEYKEYENTKMLVNYEGLQKQFKQSRLNDLSTGVVLMACGEATPHHLKCWEYMRQRVEVAGILFEGESYFLNHPQRRKPFLPLSVRASIAVHQGMWVAMAPEKPRDVLEESHYGHVVRDLGVGRSFATEGFPQAWEKVRRGEVVDSESIMPWVRSIPTSQRTQMLLPEHYNLRTQVYDDEDGFIFWRR